MKTILLVLAVIAMAVMVVVRVLKRRLSYLFKPPLRVHLEPHNNGSNPRGLDDVAAEMESLGFEEFGAYRISEMPGLELVAFTHPYQEICGVAYHHPLAGPFVDMFSVSRDDQSLTVSNAPAGEELEQPPGRDKIVDKSLTVPHMYDELLKRRPAGPYQRIDANNFVDRFQSEYAAEMDWRMSRGGVTEEEVRRTSLQMGGNHSDAQIQKATEHLRAEYAARERRFPCENDADGLCPYEVNGRPGYMIEGMPRMAQNDRTCPRYRHLCPVFMDSLGLTSDDLHVRASINSAERAEELVRLGAIDKESAEYRLLRQRGENARRVYPKSKYPEYY